RSRVTPGTSSTSAGRPPTRRLYSVDLPTFGRPTIATSGASLLISEPPQRRLRARPFGVDLHEELQVRRHAKEVRDLRAGAGPDCLHHPAALPHHDALLRVALDVDGRVDDDVLLRRALGPALDGDRDRVGELVLEEEERLLAHELGGEEPLGPVG